MSSLNSSIQSSSSNSLTQNNTPSTSQSLAKYLCLSCGVTSFFKLKDIVRCKHCGKCQFTKCKDNKKSSMYVAI